MRGFLQNAAQGIGDERPTPKLQMIFEARSIRDGNESRISDRMPALNRDPCIELRLAYLLFALFVRPADGGGIKNDLRALEGQ